VCVREIQERAILRRLSRGDEYRPVKFTVAEKETKYLCGCRAAANASPFCDGAHKEL